LLIRFLLSFVRLSNARCADYGEQVTALLTGPWDNHDQVVIAVADVLNLEAHHVEAVLQRLRIRMVLVCVSAANATSDTASVRYESGMDWTEEEK
jgi:hypothetical protein